MQANHGSREDDEAIAHVLERRIYEQTQGRLHDVRVEMTEDRIIIHGCTATHYAKQLALEAIGEVGDFTVELDIQVEAAPARAE